MRVPHLLEGSHVRASRMVVIKYRLIPASSCVTGYNRGGHSYHPRAKVLVICKDLTASNVAFTLPFCKLRTVDLVSLTQIPKAPTTSNTDTIHIPSLLYAQKNNMLIVNLYGREIQARELHMVRKRRE